jgi:hypothetical protein
VKAWKLAGALPHDTIAEDVRAFVALLREAKVARERSDRLLAAIIATPRKGIAPLWALSNRRWHNKQRAHARGLRRTLERSQRKWRVGNNSRISARKSRRPASEGQQAGGGCYIMPGTLAACGWVGAWHGGGRRRTRGLRARLFQQLAASSVLRLGRAEL